MRLGFVSVIPLLAACRLGFDNRAQPDAEPPDAAPPTVLTCNTRPTFQLAATPKRVAATAWRDGYLVVTADDTGNVVGSSYKFVGDQLVNELHDMPLDNGMSDGGELATVAVGDQTLLVVPHDDGARMIPLSSGLTRLEQPKPYASWYGGAGSVARNTAGQIAFIAGKPDEPSMSAYVNVFLVGNDGATTGAPVEIATPADAPSLPTISAAGDDFLVVWDAIISGRRIVRAELLTVANGVLQPKTGVTQANRDTSFDAENPRGAYLPSTGQSLIAWMKKTAGDQIWVSVRNSALSPEGNDVKLNEIGNFPAVAAGTSDFLVAWRAADNLYAARVSTAGVATPMAVATKGGAIDGWDVVSRAGQAALVYVEEEGGASMVKFDPLCK